jgi:nitrate reductase molybdenum cofactor assembly chaperone NarJ/NarW
VIDTDRSRTFQAAALCLDYPDDAWPSRMSLVRRAGVAIPASGRYLGAFLDAAEAMPAGELARHYVETFDLRRRCCPFLTYYAFGDTRRRGMALLEFTSAYRRAGFEVASGELPDHLAVVCEFAARAAEPGLRLFARHRVGVELLRMALADVASPYLYVVDAVRAVLPDPAPLDLDKALALAQSGPPEEEVGLEPFAPPEYMGARR